ncbi:hypothetical protein D9M68_431020 [compost metagenome]
MKTPSMHAKSLMPALMLAIYTAASLPALAAQQNNSASAAMLEAAALQLEFGEVEQAGDTLERALRIEPNNPATLHYLGQVRLQQGQYEQAVALATRSNTRARNDAELRKRNLQLIQMARQAMGPGVAYGAMAEDEPAEIRVGLDKGVESGREAGIAGADLADSPANAEQLAALANGRLATEMPTGNRQPRDAGGLQTASLQTLPADEELRIPLGQMPPRGKCRIWFPDRPAGRQPKPDKCKKLQNRIPRGAYLVRG